MSVYRFKIYFEDDENVFREIEIKSNQTFEDLHSIIQKAIEFDDKHPASFFISNDTWRKGKEIKLLRDKKSPVKKELFMHEAKIAPYMEDPHQKIVYEFDPQNAGWTLHVELLKILAESPVAYPRISKTKGKGPLQYKIVTPIEVAKEEDEEGEEETEHETVVEEDSYVNNHQGRYSEDGKEEEMEEEIGVSAKSPASGGEGYESEEEALEGTDDEEELEAEDFN